MPTTNGLSGAMVPSTASSGSGMPPVGISPNVVKTTCQTLLTGASTTAITMRPLHPTEEEWGGQGKPERKGDKRQPRSATPNRPPKGGGRGSPKGTPRGRSADKGGKGKDTPNKSLCYAFQKGTCTRRAACGFLMIKVVSDLRPLRPNPLAKARSNAPSSKLAPASSATAVTTCTVAAANGVLPQKGSQRVGLKESPLRLPLRFRCQLDPRFISLRSTSQRLYLAASPSRLQLTMVQATLVVLGCLIRGVSFGLTTMASVPTVLARQYYEGSCAHHPFDRQ